MKILANAKTYDTANCTSTGYDVEIRDDGSMRVMYHTCWQGTRDGETWICPADEAIMRAARGESGSDDPDVATAVMNWLDTHAPSECGRRIRVGDIVR